MSSQSANSFQRCLEEHVIKFQAKLHVAAMLLNPNATKQLDLPFKHGKKAKLVLEDMMPQSKSCTQLAHSFTLSASQNGLAHKTKIQLETCLFISGDFEDPWVFTCGQNHRFVCLGFLTQNLFPPRMF